MNKKLFLSLLLIMPISSVAVPVVDDSRVLVEMPEPMQQHFLKKMRDHMEALNQILIALGDDDLSQAADIAEQTLRMGGQGKGQGKGKHTGYDCAEGNTETHQHHGGDASQQGDCGGEHGSPEGHQHQAGGQGKGFGQYMPQAMKLLGHSMHDAALEFSETARSGDKTASYQALGRLTSSCVACHQSYRIR